MKFAVRSSSISQDSGKTSTAGQMDTCLSVQGFDNIISAIQRCWASSVSYQVVEYRRQNGQDPSKIFVLLFKKWLMQISLV